MPESITLADGTVREVPTAEELKDLNTKAESAKDVEKYKTDYEKAQQELESYKGQPGAEGMKNLRTALKNAKDAAKKKGITIDDEGNIVDTPVAVKPEEVEQTAEKVYEKKETAKLVSQSTNNLDADSKAVFDKEYKELTEGKEITSANVQKYINAALAAAGISTQSQPKGNPVHDLSGNSPSIGSDTAKSKAQGVDLAQKLGYKFNTDTSKI